jgi:hypothetical protein
VIGHTDISIGANLDASKPELVVAHEMEAAALAITPTLPRVLSFDRHQTRDVS